MNISRAAMSTAPYDQHEYQHLLHHYQIRMEMAVEEKAARVNVGSMFRSMMRQVIRTDSATVFFDVNRTVVSIDDMLSSENFGTRFKVEQVTLGKTKKVMLGFFAKTNMTFTNLKVSISHQWLRDNKVYLREQTLPFGYGTDLSLIGFYTLEHPWFGDAQKVLSTIGEAWIEATSVDVADEEDRKLRQLEQEGVITRGKTVNIPFTIERSKMTIKAPDESKTAFSCDVWHVYVPRKYHANAVLINDIAIIDAQNLPQMIPQGLAKTNPSVFYQRMAKHSKFMHEHRNITINHLSDENYKKLETIEVDNNKTYTSLWALLAKHEKIYRYNFISATQTVNVSVNEKDYESVSRWLEQTLKKLSFGAWVKQPNDTRALASRRSDRYSKVFSNTSPDDGSFDPSTIASHMTKNHWKRSPPLELVFDAANEDQFPPLKPKATNSNVQTTPTISSPVTISQDIEDMLAKAIEEQEKKFQVQIDQLTARNAALEESIYQLTSKLNDTLNSIAEKTVEAMMGPNSPFFTKADASAMMERQHRLQDTTQSQLDKILSLLNQQSNDTAFQLSKSPPRKNPRTEEALPSNQCNSHDQIMPDARHEEVGTN